MACNSKVLHEHCTYFESNKLSGGSFNIHEFNITSDVFVSVMALVYTQDIDLDKTEVTSFIRACEQLGVHGFLTSKVS